MESEKVSLYELAKRNDQLITVVRNDFKSIIVQGIADGELEFTPDRMYRLRED